MISLLFEFLFKLYHFNLMAFMSDFIIEVADFQV